MSDWCWCLLMLIDTDWCWLMLIDTNWCWLVLIYADWFWLTLDANWFWEIPESDTIRSAPTSLGHPFLFSCWIWSFQSFVRRGPLSWFFCWGYLFYGLIWQKAAIGPTLLSGSILSIDIFVLIPGWNDWCLKPIYFSGTAPGVAAREPRGEFKFLFLFLSDQQRQR